MHSCPQACPPASLSRAYGMSDPQGWNPIQHSTRAFSLQWRRHKNGLCSLITPHPTQKLPVEGTECLVEDRITNLETVACKDGNCLSGCTVCSGAETFMWCFITNSKKKKNWFVKLEGGSRRNPKDPTYHQSQWPTLRICASLHTTLGSAR